MRSIISLEKELESLGGKVAATRGGMIHLILSLCRQFEDAFTKAIDGGKGGAPSCDKHCSVLLKLTCPPGHLVVDVTGAENSQAFALGCGLNLASIVSKQPIAQATHQLHAACRRRAHPAGV